MIGRLAFPIVASVVELVAALVALGPPRPAQGLAFLGTGAPTAAESLAAVQLLVWALIAGGVATSLGALTAEAFTRSRVRRRLWEVSVLGVGLVLLASGAIRHFTYEPTLAGGTVQEAESILGR
jgi:hypothetical protein